MELKLARPSHRKKGGRVRVQGWTGLVAVLFVASASAFAASREPGVLVGVLEEIPSQDQGKPSTRAVRVAFQKVGDHWQAFPSDCGDPACLSQRPAQFPTQTTWTVTFDGKSLGQVTGRTPPKYAHYSEVGLQTIAAGDPIPSVGKRSNRYATWLGGPFYRPLVTTSQPLFKDPDLWQPTHLSPATVSALYRKFREQYPKVSNCVDAHHNEVPWSYRDKDLHVGRAYASRSRWVLAQIDLGPYRCDDIGSQTENTFVGDDPFTGQWYVVDPAGRVSFLGQGMDLLDAGDYDNDGRSELLFSTGGYNRGGYALLYDDFKKHVIFELGYH